MAEPWPNRSVRPNIVRQKNGSVRFGSAETGFGRSLFLILENSKFMLEGVIVIDPANSVPMPAKKDLKPSAISSAPVIKGDS